MSYFFCLSWTITTLTVQIHMTVKIKLFKYLTSLGNFFHLPFIHLDALDNEFCIKTVKFLSNVAYFLKYYELFKI